MFFTRYFAPINIFGICKYLYFVVRIFIFVTRIVRLSDFTFTTLNPVNHVFTKVGIVLSSSKIVKFLTLEIENFSLL